MDVLFFWIALQLPTPPPLPQPPQPPRPPEVEEEVIVTATRTGRLADDQVMRVEVMGREEIEEKLLMTPGDIVMLLNETGGIRLQPTSPALGAASVRVQGLPGRFTAVLTDGLPINGTQVASLGLLQIPPMDLAQVEVIKGAASALYGPSALGGVINLVTRRPTAEHEGEVLFNVTSRSGADTLVWASGPLSSSAGYTWLTGAHAQAAQDVDGDGWADVPHYRRFVTRPKVSVVAGTASVDVTAGTTLERREGGLRAVAAGLQAVETTRADVGVTVRSPLGEGVGVMRGAFMRLAHDHQYGDAGYSDRHRFAMVEGSYLWARGRHTLVAGGGLEAQHYRGPSNVSAYRWTTPSVFLQDDVAISPNVSLSMSGRVDVHPEYGTLWSPRASVRWRNDVWDVRGSAGRGAFAPTLFIDAVDEVGVHRVGEVRLTTAETAGTAALDVSRSVGPLEASVTGFAARVHDPVVATIRTDGTARLDVGHATGAERTVRIHGVETFLRARAGDLVATASHTWLSARQGGEVPLTPRQTVGVVAAWEHHGEARVGVEVYYTGRQRLEGNPYRDTSRPYVILGVLAERRVGRMRVFVNLENLTDVRQSRFDPVLLPVPGVFGQRAVGSWAPLEGRTINGGVRIGF